MANPVSVSQCPSTVTLEQRHSLVELCSQIFFLTEDNPKAVQSARDRVIQLLAETPLPQPQLSALLSRLNTKFINY